MTESVAAVDDKPLPTSVDEVVNALASLGGEADVASIKDEVSKTRGGKPPQYASDYTYRNTIQKIIEDYCPQSPNFRGTVRFSRLSHGKYRLVLDESSRGPVGLLGWWVSQADERYWLEITDRDDLGVNLKAPQANEDQEQYWSYSLIRAVRSGDIVYHYFKPDRAVVAISRAAGAVWDEDIVWAARGTSARATVTMPHRRKGWCLGLEGFAPLPKPLTLAALREAEGTVREVRAKLSRLYHGALYFPFELSEKRSLRPAQGYLTKLPKALVGSFAALATSAALEPSTEPGVDAEFVGTFGADYHAANEQASVSLRDPFDADPALVERGIRGHAAVQNQLACVVRESGLKPRSPQPGGPNYDLAWQDGAMTFVAEIKSITDQNEEKQLRLGLGQILRFRHILSAQGRRVVAVLAVERQPADVAWRVLCEAHNVRLVWPGTLQNALGEVARFDEHVA